MSAAKSESLFQKTKVTETTGSFEDLLQTTSAPAADKKSKSKVPTIPDNIIPGDVKAAIDDYLTSKEISKSAEAQMQLAGEKVQGFCQSYQDERAFQGVFSKSYKLQGNEKTLTYASSNRWTINPQDYKMLSDILGEHSKRLLKVSYTVRLKDEVFQNEALKKALMEMVGQRFKEFFISEPSVSVSETFDQEIYACLEPEKLKEFRAFARQYKPSLR